MKQFLLYSILFCLGFLNVPRSFVHDCDSHGNDHHSQFHAEHKHHSDHHADSSENEGDLKLSQDDCHVCEIQLDFFEMPQFRIDGLERAHYSVITQIKVGNPSLDSELLKVLRGPPNRIS